MMKGVRRVWVFAGTLLAMGAAPQAVAFELDASDLEGANVVSGFVDTAGAGSAAGGYSSCPDDQRAVTGGAYMHVAGQFPVPIDNVRVPSSTVTSDGKGWYADGFSSSSARRLSTDLYCLPSGRLRDASMKVRTFRPSPTGRAKGTAPCPNGTRVITGGALVHAPGAGPTPQANAIVGDSLPLPSGAAWYAEADAQPPYTRLTVIARCFPESKLAGIRISRKTLYPVTGFDPIGGFTSCPGATRALTGGAYFHPGIEGPKTRVIPSASGGSVPTTDGDWYAYGQHFTNGDQIGHTTIVHCLRP